MAYSLDLSGRVAFVTGASSGLGAQFAKTLASAGAAVVLASRRTERLKSLRIDIEAQGGQAHVVSLDVTDALSIEAAVEQAEADVGPTHVGTVQRRFTRHLCGRTHHQHRLGGSASCIASNRRLLHEQSRSGANDQGHGHRVGQVRHQCERHLPWLHRYRDQPPPLGDRARQKIGEYVSQETSGATAGP